MARQIITRFAPSPTGYLHIGGARTALMNWLYARGVHGGGAGKFLLRIEDTDRARHNEEAVAAILDGMSWLGLDWDGEPVSQFARAARHSEVAFDLLNKGHAYRCWLAGDELQEQRDKARADNTRFESPYRDSELPAKNEPFAIRFKAPRDSETLIRDQIQGDVRFPSEALDDMVLLRSDGTPTYMLAVVVDDHDMGISHIIRGDDHLINAARQKQVYEALDWAVPVFAHMPLIHGSDGAKLSKRHGALGVGAYRDMGYLPEGLCNYLVRLGWGHGDDEIIPREKALEWFDVADVKKAASRLDLDKLDHVNRHYISNMNPDRLLELAMPFIEDAHGSVDEDQKQQLHRSTGFLKERSKTLVELANSASFILMKRPFEITGKAAKPLKKEGALAIVRDIETLLEGLAQWDAAGIEAALQAYAQERNIGFGQVGPPVRSALTAGHPSPSLGEVLYALGRDEALARLRDQTA